eukprot:maker-scaffold_27-snap-gene-2.57-mRNA-1 protein AED:0.28 eAED:0.28 QI:97/1/1/1/1/1/2/172/194
MLSLNIDPLTQRSALFIYPVVEDIVFQVRYTTYYCLPENLRKEFSIVIKCLDEGIGFGRSGIDCRSRNLTEHSFIDAYEVILDTIEQIKDVRAQNQNAKVLLVVGELIAYGEPDAVALAYLILEQRRNLKEIKKSFQSIGVDLMFPKGGILWSVLLKLEQDTFGSSTYKAVVQHENRHECNIFRQDRNQVGRRF